MILICLTNKKNINTNYYNIFIRILIRSIMGNTCCTPQTQQRSEFSQKKPTILPKLNQQNQNQPQIVKIRYLKGNAISNQYILVTKSSQFDQYIKQIFGKKQTPEQLIKRYKINQRKFKKTLENLIPIKSNQIPQPYLIKYQNNSIYIGQWAYDQDLQENVPHGLGRLYQEQYISQGYISTKVQSIIQENQSKQIVKKVKIVTLNGQGRRYNQLELYQGIFEWGQLQGHGLYQKKIKSYDQIQKQVKQKFQKKIETQKQLLKNITKSTSTVGNRGQTQAALILTGQFEQTFIEYSYIGDWYLGNRNGRGKQKVKKYIYTKGKKAKGPLQHSMEGYSYEGDFVDNKKTGRGYYVILLNHDKKVKLNEDMERYEKQLRQISNTNMMKQSQERNEKIKLANKKQQFLKTHYTWEPEFMSLVKNNVSIFQNIQFQRQRKLRKFYEECYRGQFFEDQFQGQGIYIWNSGKMYNGSWKNSKMHGYGEFIWPNGIIYRGQYKDGSRHGKGIIIWSEYRLWRGSWAFGLRHGYGESISISKKQQLNKIKYHLTIKGEIYDKNVISKKKFSRTHELQNGMQIEYSPSEFFQEPNLNDISQRMSDKKSTATYMKEFGEQNIKSEYTQFADQFESLNIPQNITNENQFLSV